jgi:hypothetical protein
LDVAPSIVAEVRPDGPAATSIVAVAAFAAEDVVAEPADKPQRAGPARHARKSAIKPPNGKMRKAIGDRKKRPAAAKDRRRRAAAKVKKKSARKKRQPSAGPVKRKARRAKKTRGVPKTRRKVVAKSR